MTVRNDLFDAKKFYLLIDAKRRREKLTLFQLCVETGLGESGTSVLLRLKNGKGVNLETFLRLSRWLGISDLRHFVLDGWRWP